MLVVDDEAPIRLLIRFNLEAEFPLLNAWLERIKARPAIAKIL